MKKRICFLALISVLFPCCKKTNDGTNSKEDLSYLITTYHSYTSNNNAILEIWSYDGYKQMSYKYFINGKLLSERKNYFYDGLNASWDYYNYSPNTTMIRQHVECEYIDETYRRAKYYKTEDFYEEAQHNCIYETFREYEGKKTVSYKYYKNGMLIQDGHDYNYDGLHCSYKMTYYSLPNSISEERSYNIVYLDDSYLRTKTQTYARDHYDANGILDSSSTRCAVYDYEGKKTIGSQVFVDGILSSVTRDYQYYGLICYYYSDIYRNGELFETTLHEVNYLE